MPTIPARYYYKAHSSVTSYAYEGEDISVDQLLDDEDKVYYETQPSGEENTPKVLIFNDWSASNWTEYKLFKIKEALSVLFKHHFQVYYHKLGQWILLSPQTLNLQLKDYQEHVIASDSEALRKSAVIPLNTPLKSIRCLDYFELNALIDADYDPQKRIAFRSDIGNKSQEEIEAAWSVTVVEDVLNRDHLNIIPTTPIRHLFLTQEPSTRLVNSQEKYFKLQYNPNTHDITAQKDDEAPQTLRLSAVKTVDLFYTGDLEINILNQAFGNAPNQIERVRMKGNKGDLQALSGFDWTKLRMLTYEAYDWQHSYNQSNASFIFRHILPHATWLTHLTLNLHGVRLEDNVKLNLATHRLTSFTLKRKRINLHDIFSVLHQNRNLEVLKIEPGLGEEALESLKETPPHALKALRLDKSEFGKNMTGKMFQLLLEKLPQLQELTFANLSLTNGLDFKLAPNSLPHLKHINFDIRNIGIDNQLETCLPALLAATPHLETFEMWPGTELPRLASPLTKLKTVTWFGILSPTRFNSLFASAPNLSSLTFVHHVKGNNASWSSDEFSLYPSLREIDLFTWTEKEGQHYTPNSAECILRKAVNLEIVRIRNPEQAPQWLHAFCKERAIQLLPTAYETRSSDVKQAPKQPTPGQTSSAAITALEPARQHQEPTFEWMKRYFKPKQEKSPDTLDAYLKTLTNGTGRNQLVYLRSRQLLNALMLRLEQSCDASGQPIFVANEPRHLNTSSRHMKREGNIGTVESELGGGMMTFVQAIESAPASSHLPPIIIINNDNFTASDNARYNTTFDPVHIRKADKVKLPQSAIVIVLMNIGNPETYKKADLISRFAPQYRTYCPLPEQQLLNGLPQLMDTPEELDPGSTFSIEFYNQDNWSARLDGHWVMDEQWVWHDGVFADAAKSQKPVVLRNAPVENPNFQWYWARSLLKHAEKTQQAITTHTQTGYDWEVLGHALEEGNAQDSTRPYLLNAKYLTKFFEHYEPRPPNMDRVKGLIELNKGKTLNVYQTSPISLGNRARLYSECLKHNVKLVLNEGPFQAQSSQVCVIQSADIDLTLEQEFNIQDSTVIDISEVDATQLLGKTTPQYDETQKKYTFHTSDSFLLRNLEAGAAVILKGDFTPALIDSLAHMIIFDHGFSGQLIMLSPHNAKLDVFVPEAFTISQEDKYHALIAHYPESHELVTQLLHASPVDEPYIRLKRRMGYIMRHVDEARKHSNLYEFSQNNWDGLERLNEDVSYLDEGDDVMGQRKRDIEAILKDESIVLVLGKTGGGKTEFVKRTYPDACWGLDELLVCLERAEHERVLWVGDEANISPSNWSMFENLPHSLFIQEKHYKLTLNQQANFKAMFIANPYSYGGERKIATLFFRHGNTCIFDPLPADFIQHNILEPLFNNTGVDALPVLAPILHAYRFMAQLPGHMVLVTPRELCTLTLLTISTCTQYPHVSPEDIAYFFTYHISKAIAYEQHGLAFSRAFPDQPSWEPNVEHTIASADFFLTDSRKIVLQLLEAFMRLRHFRQEPNRTKEQKISGLGTFLIEGEPAQGKSVLLDSVLAEENPLSIPASMSPEEKESEYLRAFREGRAVRADENNTVAMFEKKMNTLLSGYDFETDKISDQPGFMVFTSQNPITMDGRRAMSNAEARRAFTWKLKNYTPEELCQIAEHHGMTPPHAKAFVTLFQQHIHKQIANDETPWTVRELVAQVRLAIDGFALKIQTQYRRYAKRNTLKELINQRDSGCELKALSQHENQERSMQAPPSESYRLSQIEHEPSTSTPSFWLLRFLPELTGGVLFLAGLALLLSAMASTGIAVGMMVAGVGLFAAQRIKTSCTSLNDPEQALKPV